MKLVFFRALGLSLVCFLFFSTSPAMGETMYVRGYYSKLLKEPAQRRTKIMKIKRGEEVNVLDTQKNWIKVDYDGKLGWMHKRMLTDQPIMKRGDAKKSKLMSLARGRFAKTQAMTTVRRLKAEDDEGKASASVDFAKLLEFEKSSPSSGEAVEFFYDQNN